MTPSTRAFVTSTVGVLALDQVTKLLVRWRLPPYKGEVSVVPDLLSFVHAQNKGAALSSFSDFEHRYVVFYVSTAIAAAVILWTWRQLGPGDRLTGAAIGTLLGGALGNLVDRIAAGHVTDMIKVYAGFEPLRSWCLEKLGTNVYPIFNVADIAIFAGVFGFLLPWLVRRDRPTETLDVGSTRPTLE